jgi:5-dehydro-2-deoxygluconokinase
VLVLGQDAPLAELAPKITLAARHPICRGFAVGRTIFGEAARAWFAGAIDDAATVDEIAARYSTLIELLFDSNAAAASAAPAKTAHLQSTH